MEVAHRSSNAEIHWHLDENYIGTTTTIHQLEVSPKAGKHKLMVIDADGFQTSVEFDIEEKFVVPLPSVGVAGNATGSAVPTIRPAEFAGPEVLALPPI